MKCKLALLLVSLLSVSASVLGQTKTKLGTTVSNTVTGPSVALSCADASGGAAVSSNNFYRGTVSGGPYALVGSNTSCAFNDTTVLFATTYFYVATSVNGSSTCPTGNVCESAYSNQATATVGSSPIPGAPTALTVGTIIAGNTNVPLKWLAPPAQVGVQTVSYSVWRCWDSDCPSPPKVATVAAPLTAYTDTGCIPGSKAGRTCYYEVKANDLIAGVLKTSKPSNIVKAFVE